MDDGNNVRIAVIGGGIVGASTAYHAAALGADVVLVDGADVGQATAAGAGIVGPWLSRNTDPQWQRIAWPAAAYYPTLIERLDGQVGYAVVGALYPDRDDAFRRNALTKADEIPQMGAVSTLDPAEAKELFPPLRADLAAIHVAGVARVDGRLLRDALRRAAIARGATERRGTARLAVTGGRVRGLVVDDDTIGADVVVAAAGAWTGDLTAAHGIDLPVSAQRGQIVHLDVAGGGVPTGPDTADWPVVQPPTSHYLLAFPGGRVVVGATRETGSGFDYRLTAGGVAEVLAAALDVAPALADATLIETRIGFRPASEDGLPLLGACSGLPGLVVATGLGHSGLTIGPYAGLLAAQVALGEEPELDLRPYDPQRGDCRSGAAG